MNRRLLVLTICLLLFLIYFLNKRIHSTHDFQNENSIAILKEKNHDVQVRKSKSLSWDDTNLGERFQYNDSILTMKESRANVAFNDGTNLEIGPDSLVVLEPPQDKQSGMGLNLKKGSATLRLKKGEKVETKDKIILAKEDATIKLGTDIKNIVPTPQIEVYDLPRPENPPEKVIEVGNKPPLPPPTPPGKKEVSAKLKNVLYLKVIREDR